MPILLVKTTRPPAPFLELWRTGRDREGFFFSFLSIKILNIAISIENSLPELAAKKSGHGYPREFYTVYDMQHKIDMSNVL